ncbi:MAG: FHA domain-containing protein [Candidatus Eremiobacteraeota bacterium]|nr:FHA domain-containing protein [Candidatus Eremiobacteraeota bacterium]
MTLPAQMRVGSVEVVLALAAFAVVAFRARAVPSGAEERARQLLVMDVLERGRMRRVEAYTPVIVGRAVEADLLVLDPLVSRRHASLEQEGDAIFVTDLQSSNGTFLNGHRIRESIELRRGDQIEIGAARITLVDVHSWK